MAARASAVRAPPSDIRALQELYVLQDAIALMTRAADAGHDALFSEARLLFRNALGAVDARIILSKAT